MNVNFSRYERRKRFWRRIQGSVAGDQYPLRRSAPDQRKVRTDRLHRSCILPDLPDIDLDELRAHLPANVDISTFMCPITQQVMVSPTLAADGHTYDYEAIKKWIDMSNRSKGNATSPMTGAKLPHTQLATNLAIRMLIQNFISNVRSS